MGEIEEDYVATKFAGNRFNIRYRTIIESNSINFACEIRFDTRRRRKRCAHVKTSSTTTPFVCIIIITIIDNTENKASPEPRAKLLLLCVREPCTKYVWHYIVLMPRPRN